MKLIKWNQLPAVMQNDAVKPYYEALAGRRFSLTLKRICDVAVSGLLIVITSPVMLGCAIAVKSGKDGPVFYRQERAGQYCVPVRIFKFRTMVQNADKSGKLTIGEDDPRITKAGKFLRQTRLDEFPQLFNVFLGQMSLVGTRPEVQRYVDMYSDEMYATLLLPPGISSEASIAYSHENEILKDKDDTDAYYINTILPDKMLMNLEYLKHAGVAKDISVLFHTVKCLFKK